jgi:transcriptional regulator with XRE-family HTH domain
MLDIGEDKTGAMLAAMGLRELRLEHLLTQEELGQKAGVSKATIVGIESGRVRPYPQTLRKLAEALDVPPSALAEHLRAPRRQRPLPDV